MTRRFWKGLKNLFTTNVVDDSLSEIDAASDFEEYLPIPPVVGAFLTYKPEDIADQLTLMDWKTFKAVTCEEVGHSAKKDFEQSPNISKLLGGFVSVSTWVQDTVLSTPTVEMRAAVVKNFIMIARRLHKLNNLHSAKAVLEGLHVEPILRLASTWKNVSSKNKRRFRKLYGIYSCDDTIDKKMWQAWNSYGVRCIPNINLLLGGMEEEESIEFTGYFVDYLQTSKYGHIGELEWLQEYLTSIKYTVEMMRFFQGSQELDRYHLWNHVKRLGPEELCRCPLVFAHPPFCKYDKITAGARGAFVEFQKTRCLHGIYFSSWFIWGGAVRLKNIECLFKI